VLHSWLLIVSTRMNLPFKIIMCFFLFLSFHSLDIKQNAGIGILIMGHSFELQHFLHWPASIKWSDKKRHFYVSLDERDLFKKILQSISFRCVSFTSTTEQGFLLVGGEGGYTHFFFLLRFQGDPFWHRICNGRLLSEKRQWLSLDFGFGHLSTHKAY
jgi:hypothetical protein